MTIYARTMLKELLIIIVMQKLGWESTVRSSLTFSHVKPELKKLSAMDVKGRGRDNPTNKFGRRLSDIFACVVTSLKTSMNSENAKQRRGSIYVCNN